jgi:hypothetical protein
MSPGFVFGPQRLSVPTLRETLIKSSLSRGSIDKVVPA